MRRLSLFLAVLCAGPAAAHDADVIYVQASAQPDGGILERVTLTGSSLVQLAPVDVDSDGTVTQGELEQRQRALELGVWEGMPLRAAGALCARGPAQAALREGYLELQATYACGPGALQQEFRFLTVLPSNYRVVLGSQLDGERGKSAAHAGSRTLDLPRPRPLAPPEVSGAWLAAGALHVLGGADHLLLCAALLLVAPTLRRAGRLAIALSLSHAAAMGAVLATGVRPSALGLLAIEVSLAAAVVLAGLLALAQQERPSPAIALAFGLLHGVTAGAEDQLPDPLGFALFAVGFAAATALACGLWSVIGRLLARRPLAQRSAAAAVVAAGAFLVVDRLLAFR